MLSYKNFVSKTKRNGTTVELAEYLPVNPVGTSFKDVYVHLWACLAVVGLSCPLYYMRKTKIKTKKL